MFIRVKCHKVLLNVIYLVFFFVIIILNRSISISWLFGSFSFIAIIFKVCVSHVSKALSYK